MVVWLCLSLPFGRNSLLPFVGGKCCELDDTALCSLCTELEKADVECRAEGDQSLESASPSYDGRSLSSWFGTERIVDAILRRCWGPAVAVVGIDGRGLLVLLCWWCNEDVGPWLFAFSEAAGVKVVRRRLSSVDAVEARSTSVSSDNRPMLSSW